MDKRSEEIRIRDTGIPIHFRYRWMEVGINGGVTKSYTWIAIVKKPWKARDKYRRRIIDAITFACRCRLHPARVRTSFTTHCYPVIAPLRRRPSLISLVRELARQVVEAKFSIHSRYVSSGRVSSPCLFHRGLESRSASRSVLSLLRRRHKVVQ